MSEDIDIKVMLTIKMLLLERNILQRIVQDAVDIFEESLELLDPNSSLVNKISEWCESIEEYKDCHNLADYKGEE